jgi:group I intron endonuclease
MNHPGIYQITHTESGKKYIGSAKNIRVHWLGHKSDLRLNVHHSPSLQNAYNKYGPDAFTFEILEECNEDDLISREQMYLDIAVIWGFDYNMSPLVERPMLGRKHQQVSIEKMRERANNQSEETKRLNSEAHMGSKNPWFGKPHTAEWRKQHSKTMSGSNNPFFGKSHTEETKLEISKKNKGRPSPRKGKRKVALCHPDRQHHCKDKCKPCYTRQYYLEVRQPKLYPDLFK